ncbi:MAG: dicarboxylate/amino acid:cation symporter [Phycisphaerae bacterium]
MQSSHVHWKIAAGLAGGAAIGLAAKSFGGGPRVEWIAVNVAEPIGRIFLRMISMVVVPLVVAALALGVHELGDVRRLGRVGARTLMMTCLLSMAAVAIGLSLVNTIRPGAGLPAAQRDALRAQYSKGAAEAMQQARKAKPLRDTLLDLIPANPLQEMVGALDGTSTGGGMLAVMCFALFVGAALTVIPPERKAALLGCLDGLYAVTMAIIGFAMRIAPLAVGCLMFALTARLGGRVLAALSWFVLTAAGGMALLFFGVYPLVLLGLARVRPAWFFRRIGDVLLTALGTSSSNATLPTSLRVAAEELKLPNDVGRFVLTVGATGNQNGTALYEGVVVLFLAQVFGVHLTVGQQFTVVLMAVLAGVGTAGVPSGSLPLIAVLLNTVGVPGEGIGLIIGVDRVLDMLRTVINVSGDLVLATCVARGEGWRPEREARLARGSS